MCGYTAAKVEQSLQHQFGEIPPEGRAAVVWFVVQWAFEMIKIQLRAVEEKLELYRENINMYHDQGLKETLQRRIDKNEGYKTSITAFLSNDIDSVIAKAGMVDRISTRVLGAEATKDISNPSPGSTGIAGT